MSAWGKSRWFDRQRRIAGERATARHELSLMTSRSHDKHSPRGHKAAAPGPFRTFVSGCCINNPLSLFR